MTCNECFYDDQGHIREVDGLNSNINQCKSLASEVLPPFRSKLNYRVIPRCNICCRKKYNFAGNKYKLWHDAGRNRFGFKSKKPFVSATK